jgi:hypothetical protein
MDKAKLVAELIATGKFDKVSAEKAIDDLLAIKGDVTEAEIRGFLLSEKAGKKPAKDPDSDDEAEEDGDDTKPNKKGGKNPGDDDEEGAEEGAAPKKKKKKPDDDDDEDGTASDGKKSAPLGDVILKNCGHQYDSVTDMITMKMGASVTRGTYGDVLEMSKGMKDFDKQNTDFRPNEEELGQIHSMAKKQYPKEQLKVYYTKSADSDVDRQSEHFSKAALKDMAKFSPGQPVMKDHNYHSSDGVFGKIFDAKVIKDDNDQPYLAQKFYVLDTPENKSVIDGIESGINDKLSVGVAMKREDYLCDLCNKSMFGKKGDYADWCGHMPGQAAKDGKTATATINRVSDYRELSRVTVPAQRKAAVKSIMGAPKSEFDVIQNLPEADKEKLAAAMTSELTNTSKLDEVFAAGALVGSIVALPSDDKSKLSASQTTEVKKVDEELKKLLESLISKFDAQTTKVGELVEVLTKSQAALMSGESIGLKGFEGDLEWKKSVEARFNASKSESDLLREQNKERGEALKVLIGVVTVLTEKLGVAVAKSTVDIARQVGTHKDMDTTRVAAEHKQKQSSDDHGRDFYNDFNAQIEKAALDLKK